MTRNIFGDYSTIAQQGKCTLLLNRRRYINSEKIRNEVRQSKRSRKEKLDVLLQKEVRGL